MKVCRGGQSTGGTKWAVTIATGSMRCCMREHEMQNYAEDATRVLLVNKILQGAEEEEKGDERGWLFVFVLIF